MENFTEKLLNNVKSFIWPDTNVEFIFKNNIRVFNNKIVSNDHLGKVYSAKTFKITNEFKFQDFLKKYSDKKIFIYIDPKHNGNIIVKKTFKAILVDYEQDRETVLIYQNGNLLVADKFPRFKYVKDEKSHEEFKFVETLSDNPLRIIIQRLSDNKFFTNTWNVFKNPVNEKYVISPLDWVEVFEKTVITEYC